MRVGLLHPRRTPRVSAWVPVFLTGALGGWGTCFCLQGALVNSCVRPLGNIPGSAVLVFDIHVIDFHNPADSISVTSHYKPPDCSVLSKKGDYLKYHYNASLLDGTLLDST